MSPASFTRPRPASLLPLGPEFPGLVARREPRLGLPAWVVAGRCLGVAAMACLLTRPLLHASKPTPCPTRSGPPVGVTADISRRLAAGERTTVNSPEDGVHWAGLGER